MGTPRIETLLVRSRHALGWTQRDLAENLGGSHRTVARWESGRSSVSPKEVALLAQHVYRVNRDLATQLAASIGATLIGLGLEAPPPPNEPAPAAFVPAPPPPPPPLPVVQPTALKDLIDCIVCSVADAADVVPKKIRPLVVLALRRANEVGLNLEEAAKAGLLVEPGPAPTVILNEVKDPP